MGKCIDCGAPTVDGEEYCEACLLLHDLGLSDSSENFDGMFEDMEGSFPSEDSEINSQNESAASDLNIDDDILSFLNDTTEEEPGLSDDDIFSMIENESSSGQQSNNPNAGREEDIMALDDFLNPEDTKGSKGSDMGDILSDALGVLNDPAMDEMEKNIMDLIPDAEKPDIESSGSKKQSKDNRNLFQKLFGNVEGPAPDPNEPTEEELEAKKKAEKEELKKAKAAKKAEQKEAKEAKKAAAQEEKAAAKAEKKRLKEEAEKNAPVDTGRINKAGASIIFAIAGFFALYVILGTNSFTYSLDVSSAKDYFKQKQYTKAYEKVAGIKIKEKDKKTYDKIMTVMYVNKEYDSYENYYNMEMYPQSLDSLVKGLKRYDKMKEQAKDLEIMDDMNYVKTNLVHSLKDSFNLNEDDVQYLVNMDSHKTYSEEVIKLAQAS